MAELKPMEVIMRIDFVASDGEQVCAHAEKVQELIRCKDCKHFHENVWGNEIGLDDLPIIVGHEACDAWGREWTQSCADGYCHMAERRSDGRADQQTGGNRSA